VLQTHAALRAWRAGGRIVRGVFSVTVVYWLTVSVTLLVVWLIFLVTVFSLSAAATTLGLWTAVLGLWALWLIAAVCGAVVVAVTSAARAIQARGATARP
jgi:hypothetical protein